MVSLEESIERDPSKLAKMTADSPDFKCFLDYACELSKKFIEGYISIESFNAPKRDRVVSFMEEYGGHKGDLLETLYHKHGLTDDDRRDVEPLMEQSERDNNLFHTMMDVPEDCAVKIDEEVKKFVVAYLKSNRNRLSGTGYNYLMSRLIES